LPSHRHDSARDRVLDAATTLLLERGYGATSVDEVCSAAGVTKGGLFYHFASKEELAASAVERFFARLSAAGDTVRGDRQRDAYASLDAYVASLSELLEGPLLADGCLIGAMGMQTAESHPPVWSAARDAMRAWRAGVVRLIEGAAAERGVTVDAGELADGLLAAVEGGLLLARSGASDGAAPAAVNHFRIYLRSLFEQGGVR
jgi:TetR/AcrR family transcriptional regulator, transcriptional repressor for nem operon